MRLLTAIARRAHLALQFQPTKSKCFANCHTISYVAGLMHRSLINDYVTLKKVCLLTPKQTSYSVQRNFWGVDVAFNKVDEERVRLAGPDRAAAEWILRNGGSIRWQASDRPLKDYNFLPSTNFEAYKLEDLDLSKTDVIDMGFMHLENLKHVKSIKLHDCRTIRDEALSHLQHVEQTLETLEISDCPQITAQGLNALIKLRRLKTVTIYNLDEIRDLERIVSDLQRSMPWCRFITKKPEETDSESKT